jgi:hypothetical protein
MIAQSDAQRIVSGNLAKADVATLEVMLAQADAFRQRISKILEGRTNHPCHEKPDTELKALTPNSISHDDSTVVDELRLDLASSQGTEKSQVHDAKPSVDNPVMQID